MAGEVIFARLSQLEAFGTKVVADFSALTARVQSLERAGGQPNIISAEERHRSSKWNTGQ